MRADRPKTTLQICNTRFRNDLVLPEIRSGPRHDRPEPPRSRPEPFTTANRDQAENIDWVIQKRHGAHAPGRCFRGSRTDSHRQALRSSRCPSGASRFRRRSWVCGRCIGPFWGAGAVAEHGGHRTTVQANLQAGATTGWPRLRSVLQTSGNGRLSPRRAQPCYWAGASRARVIHAHPLASLRFL